MKVCGKNVVKELIKSGAGFKKVYISKKFDEEFIIDYINTNKIKYEVVDKGLLDKMDIGNHQGIIAEIEDCKDKDIEDIIGGKFIVMLDHLEDPHNFGAIIRTCEAAGVLFLRIEVLR